MVATGGVAVDDRRGDEAHREPEEELEAWSEHLIPTS